MADAAAAAKHTLPRTLAKFRALPILARRVPASLTTLTLSLLPSTLCPLCLNATGTCYPGTTAPKHISTVSSAATVLYSVHTIHLLVQS